MGRTKQRRFAALRMMANVVDGRDEPGWFHRLFGDTAGVALELGCGRGDYTLELARRRPDRGVVGVDRNGGRLWKGAQQALDEGLNNAVFLHAPIEFLEEHIPAGRVSAIWLPFPDPLPKQRQAKHRLSSPRFLERYRRLLAPGGLVHLKTDNAELVEFAEQTVRQGGGAILDPDDVFEGWRELAQIETTYERRYRAEGRAIYERSFLLDAPHVATQHHVHPDER